MPRVEAVIVAHFIEVQGGVKQVGAVKPTRRRLG